MRHPFGLDITDLTAIDLDFAEQITEAEAAQVGGRLSYTTLALGEEGGSHPFPTPKPYPHPRPYPPSYPIDPPVTTQALGEEGGDPITTKALHEEGGVTTLALGEEGGFPID